MIKLNDSILILPSIALDEMKLMPIAGARAKVVEIVSKNNEIKGCWAKLPLSYMGEKEWYIPYMSIGKL